MPIDRRDFLRAGSLRARGGGARGVRQPAGRARRAKVARLRRARRTRRWSAGSSATARWTAWTCGARAAGAAFPMYFISAQVPVWDPKVRGAWTLEVSGAVQRPLTLTLEELAALPSIVAAREPLLRGRLDRGRRVARRARERTRAARGAHARRRLRRLPELRRRLPRELGPRRARCIRRRSSSTRWTAAGSASAHGAPARVHSPVKLGYKNTKYLTRIVFLPQRNGGYWSDEGYEWYGGV